MARRGIPLPPIPEGADRPTILARTYPGYHEEAIELFQEDAENLAAHGYVPVSQSYADGRYKTPVVFIAALLVLLGGLGFVILLIMAVARPRGTLAATFVLRGEPFNG